MKRYTRMHSNTVCLIPITAVTYIMLTMAVLTIISFISIEMSKLYWNREHLFEKMEHLETPESNNVTKVNATTTKAMELYALDLVDTVVMSDEPVCTGNLFLLILMASAPENFEHRDVIRKTWINSKTHFMTMSELKTQTIFLVGQSSSRFINILLKTENEMTGDILMGNYLDTQRNSTLKTIKGLTWAASQCPSLYVLKTDVDTFVNLPLLMHFLWKLNPIRSNLYAGKVKWSSLVQNSNNLWYRSYSRFRFVPYITRPGYVLSQGVVQSFAQYFGMTDISIEDDRFVGTVLNMAGVSPTYSTRFASYSGNAKMCDFKYWLLIHRVNLAQQVEFESLANKAYRVCYKSDMATDWV